MKILRFGTSQDNSERFTVGEPRELVIQAELERQLGETVEIVTKRIWPDDRFPSLLSQWINEVEPELVTFPVLGYWFNFESVPLKLQRRFGRVGSTIADAGKRMADVPWIGHTAVFRAGRRASQRVIGGATYFTPSEVVDCFGACVREVARREGIGLIVQGPYGGQHLAGSDSKAIAREESRRQEVNLGLRELSEQHHVRFIEHPINRRVAGIEFSTIGNGLHMDETGQRDSALEWVGNILSEIRRMRGEADQGTD